MSGFPIRTPWDHSLVDSSPRPIAASHVLHRLLVPRHPPFALDNLTTKNKMLASTVQFSTNNQPTTHSPTPATRNTTTPQGATGSPARYDEPGHASTYRNNNPRPEDHTVVPSGPNRVPIAVTSRTSSTRSAPPPKKQPY